MYTEEQLQDDRRQRNMTIKKANELIQKCRFQLTLVQNKIITYLVSQIHEDDPEDKVYEFPIADFCRVCGITTGGKNYIALKRQIQALRDFSVWVRREDDKGKIKDELIGWIAYPEIEPQNGIIRLQLDKKMRPFFFHLKKNFTMIDTIYQYHFRKSKYTSRLYEIFSSYHHRGDGSWTQHFPLSELRALTGTEHYPLWADFRRFVLEPAVKEINEASDLNVRYEKRRKGRAVDGIDVTISRKSNFETLMLKDSLQNDLEARQLSLFGIDFDMVEDDDNGQDDP